MFEIGFWIGFGKVWHSKAKLTKAKQAKQPGAEKLILGTICLIFSYSEFFCGRVSLRGTLTIMMIIAVQTSAQSDPRVSPPDHPRKEADLEHNTTGQRGAR